MNLPVQLAKEKLHELGGVIDAQTNWWRFPAQEPVQGFLGVGPVFIVGDQPSKSEWGPNHPNRRAFYGLLEKVGGANFHLTDVYKRRGESESLKECVPPYSKALPSDFTEH